MGAWEYAGTMGNGYSFAHAKYGANPKDKHLFRDQTVFLFFCLYYLLLGLCVESPRRRAIVTAEDG